MQKTQRIFTSQAKSCLSARLFFATPIEDSCSHLQKPMGFRQCERESSIGVTKNGPAEKQYSACEVKNYWAFNISMFFDPKT